MTVLPSAVLLDLAGQHVADLRCAAPRPAPDRAGRRRSGSGAVQHFRSLARGTAAPMTRPAAASQPCGC